MIKKLYTPREILHATKIISHLQVRPPTVGFCSLLTYFVFPWALILLGSSVGSSTAQTRGSLADKGFAVNRASRGVDRKLGDQASGSAAEIRIIKDQPTVYIAFERIDKREPILNGESDEGIWLRLYNNTRWPIELDMNDPPSESYGDAVLFYEILAKNQVIIDARCHVCSKDDIAPGKSLLFSVPQEYLAEGRSMRIKFAYQWEQKEDDSSSGEPQHFVYFYSSRLPKGFLQARSR